MNGPLDARQQAALIQLLRIVADGESKSEENRCKLCEVHEFDPYEAFKSLQGDGHSQKGWVSTQDLRVWLQSQPHSLASAMLEDVAGIVALYGNTYGELRYEGFLRLVLPKEPSHSWLREVALVRGSQSGSSWRHAQDGEYRLAHEVSFRLSQLFDHEIDVNRQLKYHRKNLRDLLVDKGDVLRFLDSEQGSCAGMGGLISPNAVRWILVDHLQALLPKQCDALIRRINPSGACLAPFDELAKILSPRPSVESVLHDRSLSPIAPHSPRATSPYLSRSFQDTKAYQPAYTAPPSYAHPYRSGSRSPRAISPHLQKNFDDTRSYHPIASSRHLSPRSQYAAPPPANTYTANTFMNGVHSPRATSPHLNRSLEQPIGSMHLSSPSARQLSPPPSWGGGTWDGHKHLDRSRDWAPGSDPWGFPGSSPAKKSIYPSPARSLGNASTHASTADFTSPLSLRSRHLDSSIRSSSTPAGGRQASAAYSAPYSPPSKAFGALPNLHGSRPDGSRGLGASTYPTMDASPRSMYRAISPAPAVYASPPTSMVPSYHAARSYQDAQKQEALTTVLNLMALHGRRDLQVEDAKAALDPSLHLESIFKILDRFHKMYIADTDIWQFTQDFGATLSFATVCSLVREIQLRRTKVDPASVPGRLSYRDIGHLVHPAGSREHEAMNASVNDDEARSIHYLLRYSDQCPGCGLRVQRDANAEGCPSVRCPSCGHSFRSFMVVGDTEQHHADHATLPVASQYHLHKLVETAARAAEELEHARRQLSHIPGVYDVLSSLSDAFAHLTNGKTYMTMNDIRRCFAEHHVSITEKELQLLWHRLAPEGNSEVSFPDFSTQLKPRPGGLAM